MKKQFRVPENLLCIAKHAVQAFITVIPEDWRVVRGILVAPDGMIASGEALASTQLVFSSRVSQMIVNTETGQFADIFGVLIQGKKPHSIQFGESFGHCEVMPMEQSKLMACHFINLGYRGRLTFRWRDYDGVPYECMIWMPHKGKDDAPLFTIENNWDNEDEPGRTVLPMLELCESLKLEELPEPAGVR